MSGSGNGHVRVGDGGGRSGDDSDPRAQGGEGSPSGGPAGHAAAQDGAPISRLAHLRPGPAALIAIGLIVLLVGGWRFTIWRVGEGTAVPCESFAPNPAIWHPFTTDEAAKTPITDYPPEARWGAAVRETNGTMRCVDLVGRSEAAVAYLLGKPTETRDTEFSEVNGLSDDDRAWSFTRDAPRADAAQETTAVIVRFRDGRAVSIRRFHRVRVL